MQKLLSFGILLLLIVGVGYWYLETPTRVCQEPITYSVGVLSEDFGISKAEARDAIHDAEMLWEDVAGLNLFEESPEGELVINFLYDERQEITDREHRLRDVIERKENFTKDIQEQYDTMVGGYDELRLTYEERSGAYEDKLLAYNEEVSFWNNEGGAPKEEFERLEKERQVLDDEGEELALLVDELNASVDAINQLGEEGNEAIRDYNEDVERYNNNFNAERNFVQGDYQNDVINIYQFDGNLALRLVLAHEFGHALSLGHVENEQSVMYYLMEGQHEALRLSNTDRAELMRVCGERLVR